MSPGSLRRLLRGLAHRGPATALLVLIALVAAAAAAVAPAYQAAARVSVTRSTFAAAPANAGQLEASLSGGGDLADEVSRILRDTAGGGDDQTGDRAGAGGTVGLYQPAIDALTASVTVATIPQNITSRTGVCAHLRLVSGHCPTAVGEVLESQDTARFGPPRAAYAAHHLEVVGVYAMPSDSDPYWFGQYGTYFPTEMLPTVFTTEATVGELTQMPAEVVDVGLETALLTPRRLATAVRGFLSVATDQGLEAQGASVTTTIAPTAAEVHRGWTSLAIPTLVATGSLLVLAWLLLFLVVTEDVETRGDDIALARLRGLGRGRVLAAGIAEPLLILLAAVPAGTLLGWYAAHLLAGSLFGPDVPVGLPVGSWALAGLAMAGGLAAVLAASRRVFARGVLEQWRPTVRSGPRRGWIFDAVAVTAAAAGLVELKVSGAVSSSSSGVQVELVPALLALAAAAVLSRLLPPACRWAARRTRRSGGLGVFLAVRHVARRPGGTRSVMVLASALAIALFGVAAWTVGVAARTRVAAVTVGAPTVLTVTAPAGTDPAAVVDRVDPGGRRAVAVTTYSDSGQTLLAVDPQRFAAVAAWAPGTLPDDFATALTPPATAPVMLRGDGIRLHVTGKRLSRLELNATVTSSVASGPAPVELDLGPDATADRGTYTGSLNGCPCTLDQLFLGGVNNNPVSGTVTIADVETHDAGGWHGAGDGAAFNWRVAESQGTDDGGVQRVADGLRWTYGTSFGGGTELESTDHPDPLPAVASAAVAPVAGSQLIATGLDAQQAAVDPVASVNSVPGAPASGIVVDRTYALRASGTLDLGVQQVWLADGAADLVPSLRAAGLTVVATRTTSGLRTQLDRQGPALATALLLFDASVAAALAAIGAVVSLVAAGRRRRYEYAALLAAGAGRRLVWRSLALEQTIVLGYGLVLGVVVGLVGIRLAVPRVPVLTTPPLAPALDLAPHPGPLLAAVAVAVLALLASAAVSTAALVRTVRPAALREGMA